MESRPSVTILQLRIGCIFVTCIVNSSWCWTSYAINSWSKYIKRLGFESLLKMFCIIVYISRCSKVEQEITDDDNFTKPKHNAGAYGKRNESILTVSIQNTQTDPAGVNFNVSHLNLNEPSGMPAALRNYMFNLLTRRNAVTSMDLDHLSKCRSRTNSYDSEKMTLTVQKMSVECDSRRNSIDSMVSFKVSETEINMKANSGMKKHHIKTTQRRQSGRRTSGSSIESQKIAPNNRFKYRSPYNNIRLAANAATDSLKDASKIRRGCYAFNANGDQAFLNQGNSTVAVISNEDAASSTSVNVHDIPSNNEAQQDESIDSNEIHNEFRFTQRTMHMEKQPLTNGDMQSSGSIELQMPLGSISTSYSGRSQGNKTHSRSSKASCDVGIQADAFDIAAQTMALNDVKHAQRQVGITDSEKLKILLLPSK